LLDPGCGTPNYAASGLQRDFVLLQAVMRALLGPKAKSEAIRLHALSVISECIFYSLAADNLHHAPIQLAVGLPNRARLARFVAQRCRGGLDREGTGPEISIP
jgi:hypothetical protein